MEAVIEDLGGNVGNMEILIKTTNACNLHCKHCLDIKNKNNNNLLYSYKILKDWLPKNSNVSFFGGEPLLGDIKEMYSLTKKRKDCHWRITSNLIKNFSELDIKLLKNMNIITTSFDLKIRFENIKNLLLWIKNIKFLKQNTNAILRLNICLTNEILNKKNIEKKILKLISYLKFDEIFFIKVTNNNEGSKKYQPNIKKQEEFMDKFYTISKDKIINCCAENIFYTQYENKNSEFPSCSISTLTIHPSGNITTCPQLSEKENYFANIKINSFEKSIKKRKLCTAHPLCYSCEYFNICEKSCWKEDWSNGCPYYKEFANKIRKDFSC